MIVLVWNVGATWRYFSPASPPINRSAPAQAGTLNVRQNFLLGRKVDINKAGRIEISGLPGISDRVADSVVETRARIGRFRRPEDLLQAKGIKEKKLKKILPFLSGFPNN
jgi:competence ComEA-like helix-hairpin-helix protein